MMHVRHPMGNWCNRALDHLLHHSFVDQHAYLADNKCFAEHVLSPRFQYADFSECDLMSSLW